MTDRPTDEQASSPARRDQAGRARLRGIASGLVVCGVLVEGGSCAVSLGIAQLDAAPYPVAFGVVWALGLAAIVAGAALLVLARHD